MSFPTTPLAKGERYQIVKQIIVGRDFQKDKNVLIYRQGNGGFLS